MRLKVLALVMCCAVCRSLNRDHRGRNGVGDGHVLVRPGCPGGDVQVVTGFVAWNQRDLGERHRNKHH